MFCCRKMTQFKTMQNQMLCRIYQLKGNQELYRLVTSWREPHFIFLTFLYIFLSCYWQGVKQTEWKKFSSNGCSPSFANVKSDYLRKNKHQTISPTSQNLATILGKKKQKKINLSFSSCVWTSERVKLNSLRDSIYFPCPTLVTWRK